MQRITTNLILATLIGAAFVLVGCESDDDGSDDASSAAAFFGTWLSEDADTDSITKIVIQEGSIQMWGSCEPSDCDWGQTSYSVSGDDLAVTWDKGFVIRIQVLSLGSDGRLRVSTESRFTDGSDRDYDSVDYFVKE